MERVFAYLRVSDQSQVKGDGYKRQEEAIKAYCKANNRKLIQTYREAFTGTELDRPVLAVMLMSLEKNHHGVKTVIIERLDRLARDYFIQEAIIRDFRSKGFTFISVLDPIDLYDSDPGRKAMRQMLGIFAEYEKAMLVAKLRAARDRKRQATGRCEGRTQYVDTVEGRQLIQYIKSLHEREPAEWPKRGRRKTLQQIADQLNREEIKTISGKQWSLHRVRDIILDR
jgi:DNA invertase Pin-like site-specific DNA recombinase